MYDQATEMHLERTKQIVHKLVKMMRRDTTDLLSLIEDGSIHFFPNAALIGRDYCDSHWEVSSVHYDGKEEIHFYLDQLSTEDAIKILLREVLPHFRGPTPPSFWARLFRR